MSGMWQAGRVKGDAGIRADLLSAPPLQSAQCTGRALASNRDGATAPPWRARRNVSSAAARGQSIPRTLTPFWWSWQRNRGWSSVPAGCPAAPPPTVWMCRLCCLFIEVCPDGQTPMKCAVVNRPEFRGGCLSWLGRSLLSGMGRHQPLGNLSSSLPQRGDIDDQR